MNDDKLIRKIIVILLSVILSVNSIFSVFADTIYIGGSGSAGGGQAGNWTVGTPGDNNYVALKIGIHERVVGDFAKNGYSNCYPDVKDNYLILVPKNGYKTKSVLTDMDNIERESPHIVYGGEGGAKSAVWKLFMDNTPTYLGNAKTLISNTEPTDWTAYIPTEDFNAAGMDNAFLNTSMGKMLVSNELVSGETESRQAAVAGMALCQAINNAGGNINLKQAAKYFMGDKDAKKEYIVIVENVTCFKDTSNAAQGYW